MKEQIQTKEKEQRLTLENRRRLTISGVTDTDRFDEKSVLLYTVLGELTVKGSDLHISELSVDSGDMLIEGEINAVIFGDSHVKGPLSFFERITK